MNRVKDRLLRLRGVVWRFLCRAGLFIRRGVRWLRQWDKDAWEFILSMSTGRFLFSVSVAFFSIVGVIFTIAILNGFVFVRT